MRALSLGLAALLLGCSTSSPTRDASDAGSEGATPDADAPEGASTTCPSGTRCDTPADCAKASGGVPGCWGCVGNCCIPTTPNTDPLKACADGGTACTPSSCDGTGACTGPVQAPDGTPCGQTCGGVFVYQRAACHGGVCVGDPTTQVSCKDQCFGDYTPCDQCDPAGCVASCSPLGRNDRCFQ